MLNFRAVFFCHREFAILRSSYIGYSIAIIQRNGSFFRDIFFIVCSLLESRRGTQLAYTSYGRLSIHFSIILRSPGQDPAGGVTLSVVASWSAIETRLLRRPYCSRHSAVGTTLWFFYAEEVLIRHLLLWRSHIAIRHSFGSKSAPSIVINLLL